MNKRPVIAASALIVLTNLTILSGVWWNRSGEPEASVLLTERELRAPFSFLPDSGEDSGISLYLTTYRRHPTPWFDAEKLKELGFDTRRFSAEDGWDREPMERTAYVVIEFDGPAYADIVAAAERDLADAEAAQADGEDDTREVDYARHQLRDLRTEDSRLVPIDAGMEPSMLRQRYPERSRYLILPAKVDAVTNYESAGLESHAVLRGTIRSILTDRIHVPVQFHRVLDQERTDPLRYNVRLNIGHRHEPWIAALEPVAGR